MTKLSFGQKSLNLLLVAMLSDHSFRKAKTKHYLKTTVGFVAQNLGNSHYFTKFVATIIM